MGIAPIKPEDIQIERPPVIDERGGPVDKINGALRKPWTPSEQKNGRYVDASLGGASRDAATLREVISYYRSVGWMVEFIDDQREGARFQFWPTSKR
jgi:hypothetical protein